MKKRGVAFKKGQITVFIIIGILLLVSISTVVYFRGRAVKDIPIEEFVEVPEVAAELVPIDLFVKSCIRRKIEGPDGPLKGALRIAEEHGGYIYQEELQPDYMSPTEGNAIEYLPNSGILIPYWYYMKSPNYCQSNCKFDTMMPPLCKPSPRECVNEGQGSIEEQLERYLLENIDECLAGFAETEKQGFEVTELGEPQANVIIRDRDVLVRLYYPLSIEKEGATGGIDDFVVTIRSDIKELYTMAYEMAKYDMNNCFIGKHIQNHISYSAGLGAGKLPPIYELTIGEPSMQIWSLENVKQLLKYRIVGAVQLIGVFYTKGFTWPTYHDPNDPYYSTRQGILDNQVFRPFDTFHDATVIFNYLPWWDIYLDIKPSSGGVLMPSDFGMDAGSFATLIGTISQTKTYKFSYQYSFPTVVDIRKLDYRNDEHVFRFALEANVRANRCFSPNITMTYTRDAFATGLCDYVQARRNATINVKEITREFGNYVQHPVDEVKVTFFAGTTCLLGFTDENGIIEAKYPAAYGAQMKFAKRGYAEKIVDVSDISDGATVIINKLRTYNATVKHFKMNRDRSLPQSGVDLEPGETVVIMLKKADYPEIPSQVVSFDGSSETNMTLDLIEGNYEISAQYFKRSPFSLPPMCIHICNHGTFSQPSTDSWDAVNNVPTSKCFDDDCTPGGDCYGYSTELIDLGAYVECCNQANEWIPEDPVNISLMGGAKFDQDLGYWTLTEGHYYDPRGTIEFNVLSQPDPDCVSADDCVVPDCIGYSDDLSALGTYYETHWSTLRPSLVFG
ncbi:hypothetical protein KY360_05395 [Candidatus Woesearchaeota archaeon]|nr:hypothetical protein [Candidatus Woesearchaeota archaeon]